MTQHVVSPAFELRPHESTVAIRPVDRADAPALVSFYEALPADDRRRRFLGTTPGPRLGLCEHLCANDHRHAEGFVAVVSSFDASDGQIVGHLCVVPDESGGLEVGVAVARDRQGEGIGRRLFCEALDWAARGGVTILHATSFADNFRVLRLLASTPGSRILPTDDLCIVQIEIRVPGSRSADAPVRPGAGK